MDPTAGRLAGYGAEEAAQTTPFDMRHVLHALFQSKEDAAPWKVYTWGRAGDAALGHGELTENLVVPRRLDAVPSTVRQVAVGAHHALARTSMGEVFAWGWARGGDADSLLQPAPVSELRGRGIVSVAAGDGHSLAASPAALWAWGSSDFGELGHADLCPRRAPERVPFFSGSGIMIRMVACGSRHSVVLAADGRVFAWGCGDNGRTGHGDAKHKPLPTLVDGLASHPVASVACGASHTLALTEVGVLYTFGKGSSGQLGHGSWDDEETPRALDLGGIRVIQMAGGACTTGVVAEGGQLMMMGNNSHGELGLGHRSSVPFPARVPSLAGVVVRQVSCGLGHTLAITDDGNVYLWGNVSYMPGTTVLEPHILTFPFGRVAHVTCGHTSCLVLAQVPLSCNKSTRLKRAASHHHHHQLHQRRNKVHDAASPPKAQLLRRSKSSRRALDELVSSASTR